MKVTRKGYYTITKDGEPLLNEQGNIRQAQTRDDCYEYIVQDGRPGKFVIDCPKREVFISSSFQPPISSVPAEINLIGEDLNLKIGDQYIEPGVEIKGSDGNIINTISYGLVDTSKEGRYKLIYQAVDSDGSILEVERIINVEPQ